VAAEKPKDLGPLMFAVRDTPEDSTGFTPISAAIRLTTPLMLLRKIWTGESEDDEVKTAYQYVIDLRERVRIHAS